MQSLVRRLHTGSILILICCRLFPPFPTTVTKTVVLDYHRHRHENDFKIHAPDFRQGTHQASLVEGPHCRRSLLPGG